MADESNEFFDQVEDKYQKQNAARKEAKMQVSGRSVFTLKRIKDAASKSIDEKLN